MRVKDQYRKNPLSFTPGGHDVTIVFTDGFELTYDKVKYPKQFIEKITNKYKSRSISKVIVDGDIQ